MASAELTRKHRHDDGASTGSYRRTNAFPLIHQEEDTRMKNSRSQYDPKDTPFKTVNIKGSNPMIFKKVNTLPELEDKVSYGHRKRKSSNQIIHVKA